MITTLVTSHQKIKNINKFVGVVWNFHYEKSCPSKPHYPTTKIQKTTHIQLCHNYVATLTLGLQPRQGYAKVQAKIEPGSHIACFRESQLWEFRDFHLGVLGQKAIWVLVLWPATKYIIRGKVVASFKFGPWWVLWVRSCPWFIRAPKCSNYALTNLLFGFVQVRVSKWISCQSL
jgi:hypothetical protein